MKFTKYLITLIALLGLVFSVYGNALVQAQAGDPNLKYKNVHLWVNPEYDDPRLLVMIQGQIDGVTAPATVSFLVPSTAEMYSAGSIDASGKYTGGPPDRALSSVPGWDEISYTVTSDTFRVEYYDDIILGLPDKTIAYEFRTLYPITQLAVLIQEPKNASNYTVSPTGPVAPDTEGFDVYTYSYPTVDTQTPIQFSISYTKADNIPSLSGTSNTAGQESISPWLIIIPILIIAGIVGIIWFSTGSKKKNKKKKTVPVYNKTASNVTGAKRRGAFCPECGTPDSGTKFCPNCGTKL